MHAVGGIDIGRLVRGLCALAPEIQRRGQRKAAAIENSPKTIRHRAPFIQLVSRQKCSRADHERRRVRRLNIPTAIVSILDCITI
jgi:hypothetical protein